VCARIFYLLLAALFVYLVVTIAAFVYLEWWQAVLVSAATFLALVLGGRWLVRYTIRTAVGRFGEMAKGLFDGKSRVLRGATADVHRVRQADPPRDLGDRDDTPDLRWYEVEATVFPDPANAGPMTYWDLNDLRLVPAHASPPTPFNPAGDADEFEPHDLVLVEAGEPVTPVDGKVIGPRRMRFVVGVPPGVPGLQFRYYFEQFGRIDLPSFLPGLPPANPR
jgi:hypothetical protein